MLYTKYALYKYYAFKTACRRGLLFPDGRIPAATGWNAAKAFAQVIAVKSKLGEHPVAFPDDGQDVGGALARRAGQILNVSSVSGANSSSGLTRRLESPCSWW